MVGTYSAGDFHVISGNGGTVAITDPTVPNGGSVQLGTAFPQQNLARIQVEFIQNRIQSLGELPLLFKKPSNCRRDMILCRRDMILCLRRRQTYLNAWSQRLFVLKSAEQEASTISFSRC
jgi:hypothetical protein